MRLFREFEHTAFRLEVRASYAPSYERESFHRFLAGEPYELPWMQDWLDMVREATRAGRRYTRVRVVGVPLSDYSRWSHEVARHNIDAGEDIRYLRFEQAREVGLPEHDYWLFDSHTLLRMNYDEADKFVGGDIIPDAAQIVRHNYWRDAAWHHAVKRDDFATDQ